jgi:hypothetical protein
MVELLDGEKGIVEEIAESSRLKEVPMNLGVIVC